MIYVIYMPVINAFSVCLSIAYL